MVRPGREFFFSSSLVVFLFFNGSHTCASLLIFLIWFPGHFNFVLFFFSFSPSFSPLFHQSSTQSFSFSELNGEQFLGSLSLLLFLTGVGTFEKLEEEEDGHQVRAVRLEMNQGSPHHHHHRRPYFLFFLFLFPPVVFIIIIKIIRNNNHEEIYIR